MRRVCRCPVPNEDHDPRRIHICVRCSCPIDQDTSSNDKTVKEFYDRLEESLFPLGIIKAGQVPEWFNDFRTQCEIRELSGRKKFGHSLHGRDNPMEGREEAADGANYAFFDTLVSRRAGNDENYELALTAAFHAAKLHEALGNLRARRHTSISPS